MYFAISSKLGKNVHWPISWPMSGRSCCATASRKSRSVPRALHAARAAFGVLAVGRHLAGRRRGVEVPRVFADEHVDQWSSVSPLPPYSLPSVIRQNDGWLP